MTTLAKWRSHKVVKAGKITGLEIRTGIEVWKVETTQSVGNAAWELRLHIEPTMELRARIPEGANPIGGYYVQYEDGFESWSPAKAFEEGYTRVEGTESWYPGVGGPPNVGEALKAGAGQPMERTVPRQTLIERLRNPRLVILHYLDKTAARSDMLEAARQLEQHEALHQGCKTAIT